MWFEKNDLEIWIYSSKVSENFCNSRDPVDKSVFTIYSTGEILVFQPFFRFFFYVMQQKQ